MNCVSGRIRPRWTSSSRLGLVFQAPNSGSFLVYGDVDVDGARAKDEMGVVPVRYAGFPPVSFRPEAYFPPGAEEVLAGDRSNMLRLCARPRRPWPEPIPLLLPGLRQRRKVPFSGPSKFSLGGVGEEREEGCGAPSREKSRMRAAVGSSPPPPEERRRGLLEEEEEEEEEEGVNSLESCVRAVYEGPASDLGGPAPAPAPPLPFFFVG